MVPFTSDILGSIRVQLMANKQIAASKKELRKINLFFFIMFIIFVASVDK